MKHPIFHPDEEARIGSYASDWRAINTACTVTHVLKPIAGENRYRVRLPDGLFTIVLECTLHKCFERSDWGMLRGIWRPDRTVKPKREAR